MEQPSTSDSKLGLLTVTSGLVAVVFFVLYLILANRYAVDFLEIQLLQHNFFDESALTLVFNHLFILFATIFSGFLWRYYKATKSDSFQEASAFYFFAYVILLLRTFLFVFNPESFPYILAAGLQILITLIAMLFFLISFLNNRRYYFLAFLMAVNMMMYLASVIYSVFTAEFILPNFGSILSAVFNISFLTLFTLVQIRREKKVFTHPHIS